MLHAELLLIYFVHAGAVGRFSHLGVKARHREAAFVLDIMFIFVSLILVFLNMG